MGLIPQLTDVFCVVYVRFVGLQWCVNLYEEITKHFLWTSFDSTDRYERLSLQASALNGSLEVPVCFLKSRQGYNVAKKEKYKLN
jgi:hypothetical protein